MPMDVDAPVLSQHVIDAIDFDSMTHIPNDVQKTYGSAGTPFSLGAVFAFLYPFILQAIKALIAAGFPQPPAEQVIAKAFELYEQRAAA
jgi:hypothetical protein